MLRICTLSLAAAVVLCSFVMAAPKAGKVESTCERGVGKKACCKAFVADHCMYVSCCEVGNAAFYNQTLCHNCENHKANVAVAAAAACSAKTASGTKECSSGSACAVSTASAEDGNRRFFTPTACASGKTAASAGGACCSARGAAKAKK
jgi:hypothetical protein